MSADGAAPCYADDLWPGMAETIARYGRPLVRALTLPVSADTMDDWQNERSHRAAEVVLLLRRPNGRYLVHTKSFYPTGVFRLLSGGIHAGEPLLEAAQREAYEETGRAAAVERFVGELRYLFVHGERRRAFRSFLFELALGEGPLCPTDTDEAITAYRDVTLAELAEIATQLEQLPPDWGDWGRFRATAHRLALEALAQRPRSDIERG